MHGLGRPSSSRGTLFLQEPVVVGGRLQLPTICDQHWFDGPRRVLTPPSSPKTLSPPRSRVRLQPSSGWSAEKKTSKIKKEGYASSRDRHRRCTMVCRGVDSPRARSHVLSCATVSAAVYRMHWLIELTSFTGLAAVMGHIGHGVLRYSLNLPFFFFFWNTTAHSRVGPQGVGGAATAVSQSRPRSAP